MAETKIRANKLRGNVVRFPITAERRHRLAISRCVTTRQVDRCLIGLRADLGLRESLRLSLASRAFALGRDIELGEGC